MAIRRTLWAAVHGAAVIALRKRLPADADPDQLAADALDTVLAGCSSRLVGVTAQSECACATTASGAGRISA
jgi:hypothetical protein